MKTRQRLIVRVSGMTDMIVEVSFFRAERLQLSQARGDGGGVATTAVAKHLFRGQPVFEVAPLSRKHSIRQTDLPTEHTEDTEGERINSHERRTGAHLRVGGGFPRRPQSAPAEGRFPKRPFAATALRRL